MENLHRQRCFNHPLREAVARCPGCGRFFCRECVTEHEDRVLCARCLARIYRPGSARKRPFRFLIRLVQAGLGLWITWGFFYYLGRALLALPTSFHEGTIWKGSWW
ncbi:MAG: rhomboid family protein [Pseudomonadota bacterium]